MTTKNSAALFVLAVAAAVSLNTAVLAQTPARTNIHDHRTNIHDHRTNIHDHRTEASPAPGKSAPPPRDLFLPASRVMAPYKQWVIGANTTGFVESKSSWNHLAAHRYNLKGTDNRKYFQYEKQDGMNLGWTDNETAQTAVDRSQWFFSWKSGSGVTDNAILYGQPIAIAWGPGSKPFLKYAKQPILSYWNRPVGIDLDWSNKPVYEWAILGGRPGTKVKRGVETIILYNLKFKRPLVRFDRAVGGDIGWPGSKRNGGTDGIKDPRFFDILDRAARAMLMPGVAIGD